MTRLTVTSLRVCRGGRPILDDISFEETGGGLVALLGPNGAGKSTLLGCLAGLLAPDAGMVMLDGVPLDRLGARVLARRRAFLPQSPRAEWPITVERLVALGLMPSLPAFGGLRPDQIEHVDRALTQFDLADRRAQPVTTLSGGELSRAMLARALVGAPRILLADEPLAGLDPRHALQGAALLRAAARGGMLVVASFHDLTLAARYADRALLLRDGRMVAAGDTINTLTAEAVAATFDVRARVIGVGSQQASIDIVSNGPGDEDMSR